VYLPIGENIDWRLSATIAPCHVTVISVFGRVKKEPFYLPISSKVDPFSSIFNFFSLFYDFLIFFGNISLGPVLRLFHSPSINN